MDIHNKILAALCIIMMLLLSIYLIIICNTPKNDNFKFPTGYDGYTKKNIISINNKYYTFPDIFSAKNKEFTLSVNIKDLKSESNTEVRIILPKLLLATLWISDLPVESLSEYSVQNIKNPKKIKDGNTNAVQIFKFNIYENKPQTVRFELKNIEDKSQETIYTLFIKFEQ